MQSTAKTDTLLESYQKESLKEKPSFWDFKYKLEFLLQTKYSTDDDLTDVMQNLLDEYEKVVSVYEEYANKDKLCVSDMLKLNAEILPKLMPLMQQAQTQQSSFTPAELLRYMKIMTRYADALTDLGPKMENVTC